MKMHAALKRGLALFLTLAMMVSIVYQGGYMHAHAENDDDVVSVSLGSLIADNAKGFTEEELALIESGLLAGATYSYVAPTDESGLIEVYTDEHYVVFNSYVDAKGNVWTLGEAKLVFNGQELETLDVTGYEAYYEYDGNAFSVVANYYLEKDCAEDIAPFMGSVFALVDAYSQAQGIASQASSLKLLEDNMSSLVELSDMTMLNNANEPTHLLSDDAIAAVDALAAQCEANDGKLDLSVAIGEYQAGNKTGYILTKGSELINATAALSGNLTVLRAGLASLLNSLNVFNGYWGYDYTAEIETVNLLIGYIDTLTSGLSGVSADTVWPTTAIVAEGADYAELNTLVAAAAGNSSAEASCPTNMVLNAVDVQHKLSMFDVTVSITLKGTSGVAGDANLVEYNVYTHKETLAANSVENEIAGVVAAANSNALAAWAAANLMESEHYQQSVVPVLPDTLIEDITLEMVYEPKTYTMTLENYYGGGESAPNEVPYGYVYELPKHDNSAKAYDYYVDGVYYAQGEQITVKGNVTISRTEGDAYEVYNLYQLIADTYYNKDDAGYAILTNGVLGGNESIFVRPVKNVTAEMNSAGVLTVSPETYPSSYNGLSWAPYSYTVVYKDADGVEQKAEYLFNGATSVAVKESNVQYVDVDYALALTNISKSAVEEVIGDVSSVWQDAADCKAALDALCETSYGYLGLLNSGMLDVLASQASPELAAIFSAMKADCCNENGEQRIYVLLTAYQNEGLAHYYANAESYIAEINLLSGYLNMMVPAYNEELTAISKNFANIIGDMDVTAVLETVVDDFAKVQAALRAPSAALADAEALVEVMGTTAPVASVVNEPALSLVKESMASAVPETIVKDTITLQIGSGKPVTLSYAYDTGVQEALTQADVDKILADIQAASNTTVAWWSTTEYTVEKAKAIVYEGLALDKLADAFDALSALLVWTPVEYTVCIPGEADQIITIENQKINLPTSSDSNIRYEITILGEKMAAGQKTYTFDIAGGDLEWFVDNKYTVTLDKIDVTREAIINFVDYMNNTIGNDAINFTLLDKAGELSILVSLNTTDLNAVMNGVMGMVMSIQDYNIGINDQPIISKKDMKIYVQNLVNVLMSSGLGLNGSDSDAQNLVNIVAAANGLSQAMAPGFSWVAGESVNLKNPGAMLLEGTMNVNDDVYPLYITLDSAHDKLVQIIDLYAEPLKDGIPALSRFVEIEMVNGVAEITVTLPDKAYQAYLAALLVSGDITLADLAVTDVDTKIAYEFLQDLVPALSDENVTFESWLNTLVMMGVLEDTDIAYKNYLVKAYDALCSIWNGVEFDDPDVAVFNGEIPASVVQTAMNKLAADYAALLQQVDIYEAGLKLNASVKLANTNTYNAIYVDSAASGAINKAGLTTISGEKVYDGYTVLVLTDDVTANLTFNGTTLLNLNGHSINGSVVCNGKTFVVDTSAAGIGAINGTISGTYYMNPNGIYTLVEDANGNITVTLDADAVLDANWNKISAATLAMDVLADLVFNGYVNGELYVNGSMVYDIELDDAVGLYVGENTAKNLIEQVGSWISNPELTEVVESVFDALVDFKTIAANEWVEGEKVLVSYDLTTAPWNIEVAGADNGDYVTVNVGNNDHEKKNFTLTFAVAADGAQDEIQKALEILADTVTITTELEGTQNIEGKTLSLGWDGSACVNVDLTGNAAYAKAVCAILACGSAEMKAAVKSGDVDAMKAVFDAMTVAEAVDAIQNYDAETVKALSGISNAEALAVGTYFSKLVNYIIDYHTGEIESTRTLGSFYKTINCGCGESHTGYGATRIDLSKSGNKTYKGFTLDVTAEVGYVTVMVDIWPEVEPDVPVVVWNNNSGEIINGCTTVTWTSTFNSNWFNDFVLKATDRNDWGFGVYAYRNADYSTGMLKYTVYTAEAFANGGEPYKKATNMALNSNGTCLGTITTQQWPDGEYVVVDSEGNAIAKFTISSVTNHSYVTGERVEPTCTEDGYQKYVCSVCGDTYTEVIPATGHTHSDAWSKNADGHWHECACGDAVDFAEHTYGDWFSNGDGTKTHACEICGWEETANEEVKPDGPVKTGDEAPVVLMTALMVTAAAAAIVLVVLKKRERN